MRNTSHTFEKRKNRLAVWSRLVGPYFYIFTSHCEQQERGHPPTHIIVRLAVLCPFLGSDDFMDYIKILLSKSITVENSKFFLNVSNPNVFWKRCRFQISFPFNSQTGTHSPESKAGFNGGYSVGLCIPYPANISSIKVEFFRLRWQSYIHAVKKCFPDFIIRIRHNHIMAKNVVLTRIIIAVILIVHQGRYSFLSFLFFWVRLVKISLCVHFRLFFNSTSRKAPENSVILTT